MATRDLSRTFLQLRQDAKAKSLRRKNMIGYHDSAGLMKNADKKDWEAANDTIPPGWVGVVGETNQYIASIKELSKIQSFTFKYSTY
jgi:hypothetical protein